MEAINNRHLNIVKQLQAKRATLAGEADKSGAATALGRPA
jgi:hypothetical protein